MTNTMYEEGMKGLEKEEKITEAIGLIQETIRNNQAFPNHGQADDELNQLIFKLQGHTIEPEEALKDMEKLNLMNSSASY